MSKCEIQIVFDRPDRTYRGGERVSGEVRIQVNQDIRCNGIVLTHYWRTHGRGNRDSGEKYKVQLSEMIPLQAGEELHLPFEFVAEQWPLTYHGHYINVDHYVHVGVDVPWAIDPKHEEEYILLAGRRPVEITGGRGEVIQFQKATTQLAGLTKVVVFGLLGLLALSLSFAFVMLTPVFLIGGGIYWGWRKMIASRVGEVDLKVPHVVVTPGESLPVELSFVPRKTFVVNGITATLKAVESATSGSGTNKTTYRHTIHEEIQTLVPAGSLMAGELFCERFEVRLPDIPAWSLKRNSNTIAWQAEVRIDIPRFPDWARRTELQLVPSEFLAELDDLSAAGTEPLEERRPQADVHTLTETASVADDGDTVTGADGGPVSSLEPLLAIIQEIERSSRFGNERSEIVAAAAGRSFEVQITIDRVATTFGFPGTSPPHQNGKTIIGTLLGTGQEVQLFTVEESQAEVGRLSRNDTWQTLATVESWDSLYDRLVMYEVPLT